MSPLVPITLLALSTGLCGAARAADADLCRNGRFPAQETTFGLAKVVGAPRVSLRSDSPPCPNDSDACRGHAYVVRGDTVLTGVTSGEFVCAFFPGPGGGSAGYVRNNEIASQPPAATTPLTAWIGTWRNGDNSIVLSRDGARLKASGEAYWPSANPSPKDRPGGPNMGDMGGTAMPSGNTVLFASDNPDECRVKLTLLSPFLLAADNSNCGGMNVSFTGVYRKR